jgi:HEAT repeat protein
MELIVKQKLTGCAPQLGESLNDSNEVIRSSAAFTLFRLDAEMYKTMEAKLTNDPSPLVAGYARQLNLEQENYT